MKLSKDQQKIIDRMDNGWDLVFDRNFIGEFKCWLTTRKFLVPMRINVGVSSLFALVRRRVVERIPQKNGSRRSRLWFGVSKQYREEKDG